MVPEGEKGPFGFGMAPLTSGIDHPPCSTGDKEWRWSFPCGQLSGHPLGSGVAFTGMRLHLATGFSPFNEKTVSFTGSEPKVPRMFIPRTPHAKE
jgi:hypothetical protein